MNYTTETTYTVGIRVWESSDTRGARFIEKVLVVYGNSEDEVREKVYSKFPNAGIEYIEKSI